MNHTKNLFTRKHLPKQTVCTLFALFACLTLISCGSKNDAPDSTKPSGEPESVSTDTGLSGTTPSPTAEPLSPTPIPTYHVVIYDNLSKGTRVEMNIHNEQTLELQSFTQLLGYDFTGCYDKQGEDKELYIDSKGHVCKELSDDIDVLYAWYEPKNYMLSFTCDGKDSSQYGIETKNNIAYDSNLHENLFLNKIIGENKLVYSVYYGDVCIADSASGDNVTLNEATFHDDKIFTTNSRITLDLRTTLISYEAHFDEQEICIRDDMNQFEQRFKDDYICDKLPLDNIEWNLLENSGYNTAIIEVNCQIREKDDGKQEIYVYHAAYEHNENDGKKEKKQKEKAMKDFLLAEESHDCKKQDVAENVLLTVEVPLSKLKSSDGIYVYYGASGFGEDDWYRVSTDVKITFENKTE